MFERFTAGARALVVGAQTQARELGSPSIGPGHLLLAALESEADGPLLRDAGVTPERLRRVLAGDPTSPTLDEDALRTLGIDLEAVRARADATFGPGALDGAAPPARRRGHIPFTPDAKKVLELALREAIHLGDREIRTDHVLLGLARPRTGGADVLRASGADPDLVRSALLSRRAA